MSGSYVSEHLMIYFLCELKDKVICWKPLWVLGLGRHFHKGKIFLNDYYENCRMLKWDNSKRFLGIV